jgi:galactan 5-O-arabinofuranosyltransferase
MYPPLAVHILHVYSDLVGLEPGMAMKHLEIAGIGAMGPAAYLSWRLLLRPTWAFGIGCITMFPLFEPYKPFPNLVLVMFIPLVVVFLDVLRRAAERDGMALVRWAVGLGVTFGVLSLTYSGWFQWSAPGLFIATLILFPWREGRRNALLFLGVTAVCYLAITGHYVYGLFTDPHAKIVDNYVYFDVKADPMYIAMWRNDLPGITGPWPPIGELGGANLFTILLGVGFAAAIALGRKTTLVIALAPTIAGAFLMRFYYARQLWATRLVQLYPRTTPLLLYSLMILGGFAVYWWFEKRQRTPNTQIGAMCGLLFVLGAAGSATSDRYMPVNTDPPGAGWLAWNAHQAGRVLKVHPLRARPMMWERRPVIPPPPAIDQSPAPAPAH